mgnify:CR=1 FL=1|jgi:hypothetical protein
MYSKTAIILGCHTDSKIKVESFKKNLNYFSELGNTIYIVNSSEFKGEIESSLKSEHQYILHDNLHETYELDSNKTHIFILYLENDNLICHGKWNYLLQSIPLNRHEGYVLTNDSFVLIGDLLEFKNLYQNNEYEMVGFIDSNQIKYHYPDFLRYYTVGGISKWLNYFNEFKHRCKLFQDMVDIMEVDSTYIFEKKNCLYKMQKNYDGNIHFDDDVCQHYITDLGYQVIKLKKIMNTVYEDKTIPHDFDGNVYRSLHHDLCFMRNLKNLEQHFLVSGMEEGRIYKKNQKIKLPKYLDDVIEGKLSHLRKFL